MCLTGKQCARLGASPACLPCPGLVFPSDSEAGAEASTEAVVFTLGFPFIKVWLYILRKDEIYSLSNRLRLQ